jgi:hypothetical protein
MPPQALLLPLARGRVGRRVNQANAEAGTDRGQTVARVETPVVGLSGDRDKRTYADPGLIPSQAPPFCPIAARAAFLAIAIRIIPMAVEPLS